MQKQTGYSPLRLPSHFEPPHTFRDYEAGTRNKVYGKVKSNTGNVMVSPTAALAPAVKRKQWQEGLMDGHLLHQGTGASQAGTNSHARTNTTRLLKKLMRNILGTNFQLARVCGRVKSSSHGDWSYLHVRGTEHFEQIRLGRTFMGIDGWAQGPDEYTDRLTSCQMDDCTRNSSASRQSRVCRVRVGDMKVVDAIYRSLDSSERDMSIMADQSNMAICHFENWKDTLATVHPVDADGTSRIRG